MRNVETPTSRMERAINDLNHYYASIKYWENQIKVAESGELEEFSDFYLATSKNYLREAIRNGEFHLKVITNLNQQITFRYTA
jgi:hypothetical protein